MIEIQYIMETWASGMQAKVERTSAIALRCINMGAVLEIHGNTKSCITFADETALH